MKITSVNNDLVKEVSKLQQKKYREESGLFLLEGDKCIEEAIECGIELEHIFVLDGYDKFKNQGVIETTEAVLSKISSTSTAPKTVAVGKQIKPTWNKNFNTVLLLEDIKDAGNLGTIIRTSCAFGADAIILYGDTVDLYNPKCVRSAVGNLWKVPIFEIKKFDDLKNITKDFIPIGTLPKSNKSYWLKDFKFPEKSLIMFGTESCGLSEELKNFAKENITVEMSKDVESLNLSISAGVILYKIYSSRM